MSEEFVADIIESAGGDASAKTETEMAAEIQGTDADAAAVVDGAAEVTAGMEVDAAKAAAEAADTALAADDGKVKLGSEATPAVVQHADKVADGKAAADSEPDVVEELAAQLGWRKDHTGDDAVDASTYILKSKDIQKSMGKHNKDLKDQLQALGGSVNALKVHNENVYQSEVKKLTNEVTALKKERRAAVELADVAKVDELDEQIEQKQKDINTPKPADKPQQKATENPVYDKWVEENDWYLADDDMAKFADTVAQQYVGAPLDRVYALVRNKVQEIFPDKFAAKVAEAVPAVPVKSPVGPASPVESSSAKIAEGSFTKTDLTPSQLTIMNQFVKGGIMSEEAYIKDIAKLQE